MSLQTPIAFCIFNRPELTRKVLGAIRIAQPKKLFVIGDGARKDDSGEAELVAATRAVIDEVDWDCGVVTNFSEANLGCKNRMATGLNWAFDQSEELIILEDDCLPDSTFFEFCAHLLERYRDNEQVMMISGNNFQPHRRSEQSYYFSRWPHIWGWASWRRAWKHFDVELTSWPEAKGNASLTNSFGSHDEYTYWADMFDKVHQGEIDTWDFSWAFAVWFNNGLSILPETNLVTNLGFGSSATHTTDPSSKLANIPASPIGKIIHPVVIEPNELADQYTWENIIAPPKPVEVTKRRKWYRKIFSS